MTRYQSIVANSYAANVCDNEPSIALEFLAYDHSDTESGVPWSVVRMDIDRGEWLDIPSIDG